MMLLDNQFREIVKQQLKLRGWSQARLAQEMDVDPPYVSQYLSGKVSAGDDVKDRFFNALALEPILTVRAQKLAHSA